MKYFYYLTNDGSLEKVTEKEMKKLIKNNNWKRSDFKQRQNIKCLFLSPQIPEELPDIEK